MASDKLALKHLPECRAAVSSQNIFRRRLFLLGSHDGLNRRDVKGELNNVSMTPDTVNEV